MPAPPALAFSTDNCTIGRAMEILGERWTFVVLREVFNGIRRFDDMRRHTGIPRQVLTNRLALLVEQDVLRRAAYREPGQRERHEYRLTEKGFALSPVLVAVAAWGGRYLADAEGPPGLSAGADWEELRTAWRRVLPLETVSYEGWLAELQTYANLDWSGLDALGINL